MPRRARLELPGVPMHIIQRGVNRCAVFVDDSDRRHYLHLLADGLRAGPIALHAFALMGNHVHLLLSPGAAGAAAALMRRLGQSYVAGFNRRHGRCGPLWQDRFKSCLVDTQRYLLSVYRYIDLNPVRAALVLDPVDYGWSSAQANLGVCASRLPLVPHPEWLRLAGDDASRHAAYRRFLDDGVGREELAAIRNHVAQQRVYGSTGFQAMVEQTLGHPARCRPVGRPVHRRTGPSVDAKPGCLD